PAKLGLFHLYNIHLLHQEGGIAVARKAALQEVVEVQLLVLDNALETIVGDQPGLLERAQREIVRSEEGKTVIAQQPPDELFGPEGLVLGVRAAEDLVYQHQGRGAG